MYKKGSVGLLISPVVMLAFVGKKVTRPLADMDIFSGTVKIETQEFAFADRFSGSVIDLVLDRTLYFFYSIHPMAYIWSDE